MDVDGNDQVSAPGGPPGAVGSSPAPPSAANYLWALLGAVGGVIGFVRLKDRDRGMAWTVLVAGIGVAVVIVAVSWVLAFRALSLAGDVVAAVDDRPAAAPTSPPAGASQSPPADPAPVGAGLRPVVQVAEAPDCADWPDEIPDGTLVVPGADGEACYLLGEELMRLHGGSRVDQNEVTGEPEVLIDLPPEQSMLFAQYTSEHVGESIAIVVGDEVVSAPNINGSIPNGDITVSGFDEEEAARLVDQLGS